MLQVSSKLIKLFFFNTFYGLDTKFVICDIKLLIVKFKKVDNEWSKLLCYSPGVVLSVPSEVENIFENYLRNKLYMHISKTSLHLSMI